MDTVLGMIKVLAAGPPRPPADPDAALVELLTHGLLQAPRARARIERWVPAACVAM